MFPRNLAKILRSEQQTRPAAALDARLKRARRRRFGGVLAAGMRRRSQKDSTVHPERDGVATVEFSLEAAAFVIAQVERALGSDILGSVLFVNDDLVVSLRARHTNGRGGDSLVSCGDMHGDTRTLKTTIRRRVPLTDEVLACVDRRLEGSEQMEAIASELGWHRTTLSEQVNDWRASRGMNRRAAGRPRKLGRKRAAR